MNMALARLIAGQIFLHACMTGMRQWPRRCWPCARAASAAAVGVLLALFALTQVFLALPAGAMPTGTASSARGHCGGHGVCGGRAFADFSGVFGDVPVGSDDGRCPRPGHHCAATPCGAALRTTPTQLRQVFSWLAIGPAVSNFIRPFFAG